MNCAILVILCAYAGGVVADDDAVADHLDKTTMQTFMEMTYRSTRDLATIMVDREICRRMS